MRHFPKKREEEELNQFSSVQSLSHVRLSAIPWTAARQASLSITNSWSLLMSTESVMPSSHLILRHPLLLLPPIPASIRVFSNESALRIRWPNNWSFSFNISPSNEYSGLISFRMDWLGFLAVQGTLNSLLQHQFKSILLIHKKWNNAIYSNMAGPRDYHTKWSKSDRERQIPCDTPLHVESKVRYRWTFLQKWNRLTDVENKLVVTKSEGKGKE